MATTMNSEQLVFVACGILGIAFAAYFWGPRSWMDIAAVAAVLLSVAVLIELAKHLRLVP